MPWGWYQISNPAANSVVVQLIGRSVTTADNVFSLHGLFITHTHTSARRYQVRTALLKPDYSGYHEMGPTFMTVVVAPNQSFLLYDPEEPLIAYIGKGAYVDYPEALEIIAVDGGEPVLTIGVNIKGRIEKSVPPAIA